MVVEQVADLRQRADRRDPPAGHDRHVVGQLLQLFQFVAEMTSRHLPCGGQAAEQLEQLLPADRVDARERLVEHQQLRVVEQRLGQLDPLPHPLRVAAELAVGPVGHADALEHGLGPAAGLARGRSRTAGPSLATNSPAGHVLVEGVDVRAVADEPLRPPVPGVEAADASPAPGVGRSCPVASRSSVVLPAPFAPTSPVIPPRSSSVTWLSPSTGPYHFETCSNSRTGSAVGGGSLIPVNTPRVDSLHCDPPTPALQRMSEQALHRSLRVRGFAIVRARQRYGELVGWVKRSGGSAEDRADPPWRTDAAAGGSALALASLGPA